MISHARSAGDTGALFDLSGTVPTNATWSEQITFMQAGSPYNISGMSWKMTFRCNPENSSPDFTLSTDDGSGTLTVIADSNGNLDILQIAVPAGQLNAYEGDYIADLASKDAANTVMLWAHGVVSLRPNPVSF